MHHLGKRMQARGTMAMVVLISLLSLAKAAADEVTTRVSVNDAGTEANVWSLMDDISHDGRFVVMRSPGGNLIPGNDNNGRAEDVLLHDRLTNTTRLVSVSTTGRQAGSDSFNGKISGNNRFVAFTSRASNLVNNDNNGSVDAFRHDLTNGRTIRISVNSNGDEANAGGGGPSISDNGKHIIFASISTNLDPNATRGHIQIFGRDVPAGTTTLMTLGIDGLEGDDWSSGATLSGDGRYVLFRTMASNFMPNGGASQPQRYILDRDADGNGVFDEGNNTYVRVSEAPDGSAGNGSTGSGGMSPNGRYVAFTSASSNIVPNDNNGEWDVFARDRDPDGNGIYDEGNEVTVRVSVASDGSEGNGDSGIARQFSGHVVSDTGLVVFESDSSNLVPADGNLDYDVFVHDLHTSTTRRVSLNSAGGEANGGSWWAVITADGRSLGFSSEATNLVPDDNGGRGDTFVRGPELSLVADPLKPKAGVDTVTLSSWDGLQGGPAILVAVDVNGSPTFLILDIGTFDAAQSYVVSGLVPSGLAGIDLTLRTYALGWFSGKVVESHDRTLMIKK